MRKIKICLEKKLLTEDDVEDGLFTRDELTDLLYNNMKVKELVEMNGWMDVSRRLIFASGGNECQPKADPPMYGVA